MRWHEWLIEWNKMSRNALVCVHVCVRSCQWRKCWLRKASTRASVVCHCNYLHNAHWMQEPMPLLSRKCSLRIAPLHQKPLSATLSLHWKDVGVDDVECARLWRTRPSVHACAHILWDACMRIISWQDAKQEVVWLAQTANECWETTERVKWIGEGFEELALSVYIFI